METNKKDNYELELDLLREIQKSKKSQRKWLTHLDLV